jgi:hypothetical protein
MSSLSHLTVAAPPRADTDGSSEVHRHPGLDRPGNGVRTHGRSSVWREQVRSRLADLQAELDHVQSSEADAIAVADAERRLREAREIVNRRPSLRGLWTGVDIEATWMRIHAVEVALTRLARSEHVRAKLADLVEDGVRLLGDDHPRVKTVRAYAKRSHWNDDEREDLAQSVRAIYAESDKENVRLRSFRNILLGATLAMTLLAVIFAALGFVFPSYSTFLDEGPDTATGFSGGVGASGSAVAAIEFIGLIGATLVGAVAIRRMHGTSTVYGVPMASLLLKMPMGALSALVGIVVVRAGLAGQLTIAGQSQAFAYALLFGASQQGFTGLVDRQASNVLNSVSSRDNT